MTSKLPDPYGLFGENLSEVSPEKLLVCEEILGPLENLRAAARRAGFTLKIASAHRSFERQLAIWNGKASGEIPLLDSAGKKLSKRPESDEEMIRTILFWSALPGGSRHHFGTEIDVFDASSVDENYEVELTPEECSTLFLEFHNWLSKKIEEKSLFGFERVFIPGRGKIRPEKWHLSHLPTARKIQSNFSIEKLCRIYEETDIACKEAILKNIQNLAQDYIFPYFV